MFSSFPSTDGVGFYVYLKLKKLLFLSCSVCSVCVSNSQDLTLVKIQFLSDDYGMVQHFLMSQDLLLKRILFAFCVIKDEIVPVFYL